MKNKYISFVALAAAALATSCASDDLAEQKQEETKPQTVTLTAAVSEGQTRVGMTKNTDNTASFYWHSTDKILVQTVKDGSAYSGAEFSTKTATGEASASFTGEIGTDYEVGTYAVYPYDSSNQKHTFDASDAKKLTYVLPASYTNYTPGSNIFSKTENSTTTYPSNPTNMPMLGTIADGKVSFKCLGGLAVIRIDKMPATSGTLTVSADQQLSGSFTVSDLSADGAEIATTSESVSDADKKVTFTFSEASTESANVFYLPLATGTYTNLKIVIAYGDGNSTTQTIPYGTLEVARAHVTAIPLSTDSKGKLRYIVKNEDGSYTVNGHQFVDLGDDVSVLWATTSIGAATAYDDGNYYAWGETSPKTEYTTDNYEYSDNPSTLDAAHDAATANWGTACRMPTTTDFANLLNNCNWTWEDMTNSSSETIKCYKGTSKTNSNIIYFPTSGTNRDTTNKFERGIRGSYWSSTKDDDTWAYCFYMDSYNDSNTSASSYAYRYIGCPVRTVAEKPSTTE